jgi:hypothetical protein
MRGDLIVDLGQELFELDRAVAAVRRADHGAISGVKRGEQARRAVAQLVARAPLAHPGHHRERRLRARQHLDLAFSSTLSTTAASGGFRYSPTMS